jgi:HJR/Mrr/RecB family endonuclease
MFVLLILHRHMADDEGFFRSLFNHGENGYTWDSADFGQLTSSEFEQVVGALFTAEGYDVERAGPTVERGIDLLARKSGIIRSKTAVIAVISPGGTIAPATVEQVERARTMNGAANAVIVRPETFNDTIRETVCDADNVELLAGRKLIDRLSAADVQPP